MIDRTHEKIKIHSVYHKKNFSIFEDSYNEEFIFIHPL